MAREHFLDLAQTGLRMPIGADLVLREQPDSEMVLRDGRRLGRVIEQAAQRYRTPLAMPLMDLTVEKAAMLTALRVPERLIDSYHFDQPYAHSVQEQMIQAVSCLDHPRLEANLAAIRYIAQHTSLMPMGMVIGPFSLVTKLLSDPITPVFLAASDPAGDEPEVQHLQNVLELAMHVVLQSARLQLDAGAKAIVVCEPAANTVYFSPKQLAGGADIFDRFVLGPNQRLAALIQDAGADLIFHCCGELTEQMLKTFVSLNPAVLSLGSSRRLWEDARIVPRDVVLYGNLPSKSFFSSTLTVEQVREMAEQLIARMRQANHPFILGSECDVLSVPGYEVSINAKVAALCGLEAPGDR